MFSRIVKDKIAEKLMGLLSLAVCLTLVFILGIMLVKAGHLLQEKPLSAILFTSKWNPSNGDFGLLPFILGTLIVTGIALLFAVPLSLLTSVFLTEYASKKVRALFMPLVDLLSGIPSVIFGLWGILTVVPFVRWLAALFGGFSTGYSALAAGLVLSVMILPVIINILCEVFGTVPIELKNASLSLGATKWQTVKHVLLRKTLGGIIAAFVLGLSRAFGETMAVLMVAGNVPGIPKTVFDPVYPLPALIANNYGELMSIPSYDSALVASALVLLSIVIFFNILARFILLKVEQSY